MSSKVFFGISCWAEFSAAGIYFSLKKKMDTSFSPQSEPESQLTEHMEKLTVTSMVLSNVPHAHVRF